jgi:hypothetical protein
MTSVGDRHLIPPGFDYPPAFVACPPLIGVMLNYDSCLVLNYDLCD